MDGSESRQDVVKTFGILCRAETLDEIRDVILDNTLVVRFDDARSVFPSPSIDCLLRIARKPKGEKKAIDSTAAKKLILPPILEDAVDPQSVIQATRETLLQVQKTYNTRHWKADRIKKPWSFYLSADNRFDMQFLDQRILLERGTVVWAAIVQANRTLFDPRGPHPHLPAVIVYSEETHFDGDPSQLVKIARSLFELKSANCTPAMKVIADRLAKETEGGLKLAIPIDFTDGIQCYYAALLITRKHLPTNHLAQTLFPVLIAPQETQAVMVLPERYWDQEFKARWSRAQ